MTNAQRTVVSALMRPRNGNARRGRSVWRPACFSACLVWVGAALLVAACHASEPVENKEDNIMVEFNTARALRTCNNSLTTTDCG